MCSSLFPQERNVQMTRLIVIDSWRLTAPIKNSVRAGTEFCKITMTSGRRNLHSPSPTTLLTIDYRPPSWYNFLSLPSLPLPLKQKIAATIFAKKILSIRSPKLRFLCRLASFPCLLPSFLERLRANRAELMLK